jgi:hypothetical protein
MSVTKISPFGHSVGLTGAACAEPWPVSSLRAARAGLQAVWPWFPDLDIEGASSFIVSLNVAIALNRLYARRKRVYLDKDFGALSWQYQ